MAAATSFLGSPGVSLPQLSGTASLVATCTAWLCHQPRPLWLHRSLCLSHRLAQAQDTVAADDCPAGSNLTWCAKQAFLGS